MRKSLSFVVMILVLGLVFSSNAWSFKGPWQKTKTIKIGINAPITGDIPEVGEGTKFAAQMWKADIDKAGGLEVGGKKYPVELVIEDNESKAESAVKANSKMITEDEVLVIVGPQSSKQAVPAGDLANNYETPMISPWSTNPKTTTGRPYIFRASFLDVAQGPAMANFAIENLRADTAAILFDINSDYPKELAQFFKSSFEGLKGSKSVVAFETFTTGDKDFSSQMNKIINSGADVLFVPQYYSEVSLIVAAARKMGWKKPILGSDSWGSDHLMKQCGDNCKGYYFSTHYAAAGATGATKAFIDRYNKEHGNIPDDVGALTWDALRLAQTAIENSGKITGDLKKDRKAIRDAFAKIKNFPGITGEMTFTSGGDPLKSVTIVKISSDGEYLPTWTATPETCTSTACSQDYECCDGICKESCD